MIRSATFVGLLIGSVLAVIVFGVKYEVQDLEAEYIELNRGIERERQSIHVLLAEWSHLNEPARLRNLAMRYLGAGGLSAANMGDLNDIPLRDGPPGEEGVKDPPDRLDVIQAMVQELVAAEQQQ